MVSLSPTAESSSDEILEYDKGWAATNKLLRQGASFSSHERNCVFLNTGEQRFANVSAVTGLDFPDDGRGLALCDWDFDGREDFWVTNRGGPRVRFLHNRFETDNHFVALRLRGTTSNRDAIGARVEVYPAGASVPLIRTLYGGSGFLSQSSKWLHIGAGDATALERVVVRWPGGEAETFPSVPADAFSVLVEGSGRATPWKNPSGEVKPLTPSDLAEPESGDASRVVLLRPAPLPESLAFTLKDGRVAHPSDYHGKPLLLNLWATWCPNCLAETQAWSARAADLAAADIEVLSLCVDESSGDPADEFAVASKLASKMRFAFPVALGSADAVAILDVFQKSFIGRQDNIPLPSSFLIDATGKVAVIYKGPVSVDRLLRDRKLLGASREAVTAGAVPFPGRWLEAPPATQARNVALAMVDHAMLDHAEAYLRQILPLYEKPIPGASADAEATRANELLECHAFLAAILFDAKRFDEAIASNDTVLALDPGRMSALDQKARALVALGRMPEALAALDALLSIRPDPLVIARAADLEASMGDAPAAIRRLTAAVAEHQSPELHADLGNLLRDSGDASAAITHYKTALAAAASPSPLTANNLAWLLATNPDDALRDGPEALRLAALALEATDHKVPHFYGTLAAAQAETGDFDAALASLESGIAIARKNDDNAVAEILAAKIPGYRDKTPYRETISQHREKK